MDPNATLIRLLEAIGDRQFAEAREALADLRGWISRGGFMPDTAAAIEAIRHRQWQRRG